jgi:membrane-bound PQQ-dependent dehydrogenase (glucose/quinate/shikimate family)
MKAIRIRLTALIIGALGLAMAVSGAELMSLGGTPYYAVTGALMLVCALDLFRSKPRGFFVFAGVLIITLAWAVYEAGSEFWLVGSRIWIVGLLAIWLCTPGIQRALWPVDTPTLFSLRTVQISAGAGVLVLIAMCANLVSNNVQSLDDKMYSDAQNTPDWTAYGGSSAGTRYTPHAQINGANVGELQQVWETDTKRIGRFSGTPLQIGDGLYLCTAQNVIISLDPDTGEERWRFDPKNETRPYGILGNCRGVTYYKIPDVPAGETCAERIFTATTDARMIAVDKETGLPCDSFGSKGQISLLAGMGEVKPYYYFVTSPATVASGALVVGGWVMDNQETQEPSGVVRGYDPMNGELLWAWDMGREGDSGLPTNGETYTRGTPNVWSLTSADDELGLVYVPTGNATPDYFGGHRTQVMDKYASSVVAIDAKTGLTRWHFQTTHHDIWDYDVPSQPTLVDLTIGGVERKTVIVPTKRGEIFVLDRVTGEVITEVTERPVPQTDIPGERSSATQPFSTGMPSFAYPKIREQDLFGITPLDQMACRKTFLNLRYEGPMTPPSTQGTLLYPGPAGGMNWGSVAVDEQRQLMVVNNLHLPWVIHLIPRENELTSTEGDFNPGYGIGGPQRGTPFAAKVGLFSSPLNLPCLKPPYGEIAVVDLTTQKTVWRRGTGVWNLGLPYAAGTTVTAGGLIFMGGVIDGYFRAIDVKTGEELWKDSLDKASEATPMSYVSPKTGKQYVLVTIPGQRGPNLEESHESDGEVAKPVIVKGGKVIAYALPE